MISKPNLHKPEGTAQRQTLLESGPQTRYVPGLQTRSGQQLRPRLTSKELPHYPEPVCRPPPRPLENIQEDRKTPLDLDIDINTDFEENSLYQEGIISESYKRPDKSYFQEPF